MKVIRPDFSLDDIRNIIQEELRLHPRSHYIDVYKLLYQAFYGPSHLEPKREVIIQNLHKELNSMTWKTDIPYQDIGAGKGFFRSNLFSLINFSDFDQNQDSMFISEKISSQHLKVREEKIRILTDCILQSYIEDSINWNDWINKWENCVPLVKSIVSPSPEEELYLEYSLAKQVMPTHSEEYRQLYDPHYRVIHHSLLKFIHN
ncbi:MAG: hypothetical protein WC179_05890 [Candidatus Cloacimonadaceae bacterium]|jgi:hypothetical protein|nr:hypothetical protein [Candidatus Cloacimonadota bacterium]MCB5258591.1 hypothetical protein [Candidatus Cloacimonadota bacterium]MDD5625284.1 hypothetical protein [Candidatus Cloacimonadota bacterium]MDY0111950.1 hypothetical protein [Candidatus Syntrophosphaera sp.]